MDKFQPPKWVGLGGTEYIEHQQVPADITATIAEFESRKNDEIAASEESIARTAAPFINVRERATEIEKLLADLHCLNLLLHNTTVTMKAEMAKSAEYVEMAQKTFAFPMELEEENKTQDEFFSVLL